ncbi:hypothetical protein ACIQ6Y_21060 [Streptomyces sp. NPDC096205]|uniref:hypothetical protein n=1 Tax=Streptomyces sp. NPDC096205 TaxID=3366081 RepID=UPI00382BD655
MTFVMRPDCSDGRARSGRDLAIGRTLPLSADRGTSRRKRFRNSWQWDRHCMPGSAEVWQVVARSRIAALKDLAAAIEGEPAAGKDARELLSRAHMHLAEAEGVVEAGRRPAAETSAHTDAAEVLLLRVASDEQFADYLPEIAHRVRTKLPPADPRRERFNEALHRSRLDDQWDDLLDQRLREVEANVTATVGDLVQDRIRRNLRGPAAAALVGAITTAVGVGVQRSLRGPEIIAFSGFVEVTLHHPDGSSAEAGHAGPTLAPDSDYTLRVRVSTEEPAHVRGGWPSTSTRDWSTSFDSVSSSAPRHERARAHRALGVAGSPLQGGTDALPAQQSRW